MKLRILSATGVGLMLLSLAMLFARKHYHERTLSFERDAWWVTHAMLKIYIAMFLAGVVIIVLVAIVALWRRYSKRNTLQ